MVSLTDAKNYCRATDDDDILIENIPDVWDINVMLDAIQVLGASVTRINRNVVKINSKNANVTELSDKNLGKMRATYYFVGALLAKHHKSKVIFPGGCNIGARPINLHLKGFTALGAKAYEEDGYIITEAESLKGANIYLDVVSVGATINIMLAAVLSQGLTTIENAAKEPHVVDIANFLNSMGANIKGAGTDIIRIKGVKKLHGTNYSVIPDQIEAGTYMTLATITKGTVNGLSVGIVKGIKEGNVTITAKSVTTDGTSLTATTQITVSESGKPDNQLVQKVNVPNTASPASKMITAIIGIIIVTVAIEICFRYHVFSMIKEKIRAYK